jgi:SNF2 family DNA or RNA helicase
MAEDPRTKHAAIYEQLKNVRTSKTVALKPCHMLRKEFVGLDGEVHPFSLRYYQVQAVYHFLAMKRMILGDATGVGKTISTLGGLCYAWEKEPDNRVIIVSPKSAMRQWAGEIEKFTTGIKVFIASGTPNERKQAYLEFALHEGPEKAVMLVTYAPLVRDWGAGAHQPLLPNGQPDPKAPMVPGMLEKIISKIKHPLTVVYDEATAFKNDRTKTWAVL